MLKSISVEVAGAGDQRLVSDQPDEVPRWIDQAGGVAFLDLGGEAIGVGGGVEVTTIDETETGGEAVDEVLWFDASVDAVDRRHRELILGERTDECQRVGRSRERGAEFAVDPLGNAIAVVPVGDQHVIAGERGPDGRDALRISDPLPTVLHRAHRAVIHRGDRQELTRRAKRVVEAIAQGESPHGRQVRSGGDSQVVSVGGGLRRRPLVGQDGCALSGGHLQPAEDSGDGPGATQVVGEVHPLHGQGGGGVPNQGTVGDPLAETSCEGVVRRVTVLGQSDVDVGDVATV